MMLIARLHIDRAAIGNPEVGAVTIAIEVPRLLCPQPRLVGGI